MCVLEHQFSDVVGMLGGEELVGHHRLQEWLRAVLAVAVGYDKERLCLRFAFLHMSSCLSPFLTG